VVRPQAGFLLQLAVHRLQRRLVGVHPALRELPAVTPDAPCPEDTAIGMHQHNTDAGAIPVRIDHEADSRFTAPDSAMPLPGRQATGPRIDYARAHGNNSRFRAAM